MGTEGGEEVEEEGSVGRHFELWDGGWRKEERSRGVWGVPESEVRALRSYNIWVSRTRKRTRAAPTPRPFLWSVRGQECVCIIKFVPSLFFSSRYFICRWFSVSFFFALLLSDF